MIGVKVKTNITPAKAYLGRLGRGLENEVQKGLDKHGRFAVAYVRKRRFQRYPGYHEEDPGRTFLYRRTGGLQKSMKSRRIGGRGSSEGVRVSAGEGLKGGYAKLQEYGGWVNGNPWVNIPVEGALTPSGRISSRFPSPAAAMAHPDVVRLPNRDGDGWIYLLRRKTDVLPLWVQKSRVYVPPRLEFVHTVVGNPTIVQHRRREAVRGVRVAVSRARVK